MVGIGAEVLLNVPNLLLVFLPVILFAAVRYGIWMALASSVVSVAASSYLLADPRYSLAVSDPGNIWAMLFFFMVAGVTSALAARIKRQTEALRRSTRITEELYALSSTLAALSGTEELLRAAAQRVATMLHLDVTLFAPRGGKLMVRASAPAGADLGEQERAAAQWCFEQGEPAGPGTGAAHPVRGLYLPLRTGTSVVGVIGVYGSQPAPRLPSELAQLLDALRHQIAMSLERAQLAEQMQEANMLLAADELRAALLTSISHDLKTPLATILGNISSLREYGMLYDEQTRAEMLHLAEAETLRLAHFVENLLQMTRIDAGALKPNFELIDLSDLVGSAVTRCQQRLACHRVETRLAADLPMVCLDFVLTEQVLVNLLDNAAKYAPAGSEVSIGAVADAERVLIEVKDEGPGMAEGDLTLVFERFYRARAADHRQAGSGLGLAICKGFVEAMGGAVHAGNRPDRSGAVFTVMLPVADSVSQVVR
jgi:two-component system sensor histidine kinase KdpD